MDDKQVSLNEVLGLIQKRADQYETAANMAWKAKEKKNYRYWTEQQCALTYLKEHIMDYFDYHKED